MKALLADDDVMFRHMVLQTLAHTSLEISSVGNGAEAWKILSSEAPPPLAILDWMMPEYDGLEICRMVRERKSPDYTYILMITSRANKADMLKALETGVDDYISKPVNRDELLARIQIARRFLEKEERLSKIIGGWRAMVDNLPFGLACVGKHGEILRANKLFVELLGEDVKTMLGRNLMPRTIRRTADITLLRDSIKRAVPFDRVEMEIFGKDNSPRLLFISGRPILNSGELAFQIITAEQ